MSWSLRGCSVVPKREEGFPSLFQGGEKERPWSSFPLGLCVSPLSLQGIPPSDLGFGISGVLAEGREAAGGGSRECWVNPHILKGIVDFPGGPKVKNLPASAGVTGSIPGPGRFDMPQDN